MRVLFEKRVHEGLSRDNDTILAALNGGLAWHRRRKAKSEAGREAAGHGDVPGEDRAVRTRKTRPLARRSGFGMTIDGIAAVQARIQEIQDQVGVRALAVEFRRPRDPPRPAPTSPRSSPTR